MFMQPCTWGELWVLAQELSGQLAEAQAVRQQAEAALQEQRAEVQRQATKLTGMQTELDQAQEMCQGLESRGHSLAAQGGMAYSRRGMHTQSSMETATQWGAHLEAQCNQLEADAEELHHQLAQQQHEVQLARSRQAEAEAALLAAQHSLQQQQQQQQQQLALDKLEEHEAQNAGTSPQDGTTAALLSEVEALRVQLHSSEQLVAQLQRSLRAKGKATKVSSPTIAAQSHSKRRSAGDTLRSAASSIKASIKQQSSELVRCASLLISTSLRRPCSSWDTCEHHEPEAACKMHAI